MKNKLVKASLAGVAAVAIAAGGGTFAAWSDYDTIADNSARAEKLQLVLNQSATETFNADQKLAPGVLQERSVVLAARAGDTIPAATLKLAMDKLVGHEDGCTTKSEAAEDLDGCTAGDGGEFTKQATLIINAFAPSATLSDSDLCDASKNTLIPVLPATTLDQVPAKGNIDLLQGGTLAKNQRICVKMGVQLPKTATNAVQGDSATFDLKFLLEQAV
jgi:predicted ribosomally synthesized peptide with SipW-like signal peptide